MLWVCPRSYNYVIPRYIQYIVCVSQIIHLRPSALYSVYCVCVLDHISTAFRAVFSILCVCPRSYIYGIPRCIQHIVCVSPIIYLRHSALYSVYCVCVPDDISTSFRAVFSILYVCPRSYIYGIPRCVQYIVCLRSYIYVILFSVCCVCVCVSDHISTSFHGLCSLCVSWIISVSTTFCLVRVADNVCVISRFVWCMFWIICLRHSELDFPVRMHGVVEHAGVFLSTTATNVCHLSVLSDCQLKLRRLFCCRSESL